MSSSSQRAGQAVAIGFMLVWIVAAILMGFFAMGFAASWPSGFGPSPYLFVWIPFAMAGLGVLELIRIVVSSPLGPGEPEYTGELPIRYGLSDDVAFSSTTVSGFGTSRVYYQIPPFCSHCGSRLDSESATWAGPSHFKCPFCGNVGEAEEKGI